MKILNSRKLRFIIVLSILFLLYLYILASNYTYAISHDLSNSVLRLHVLANSNSDEDQELKYKVRDSIINYMNSLSENITTKEEALEQAKQHKKDLIKIAKKTIVDNRFDYDVNIDFGNFYFPTKSYGDISFPAGYYDAVKIKIGASEGQNWWCVMFPPLCFVDVSTGIVPEDSKSLIQDSLLDEEYNLISYGNTNNNGNNIVKFKFKLIELFNNNSLSTANANN